jgi:hypothetical protein
MVLFCRFKNGQFSDAKDPVSSVSLNIFLPADSVCKILLEIVTLRTDFKNRSLCQSPSTFCSCSSSRSVFSAYRDNKPISRASRVGPLQAAVSSQLQPCRKGQKSEILVVTTGHSAKSQGEVIIYPESPGYAVNPVGRWPFVKNGQVLTFRVVQHAGGRFYIQAGTPSPYLRADSCTRHADYDQLTFDKGWVLNVKVLHEF